MQTLGCKERTTYCRIVFMFKGTPLPKVQKARRPAFLTNRQGKAIGYENSFEFYLVGIEPAPFWVL
jgi:hypothetical protein